MKVNLLRDVTGHNLVRAECAVVNGAVRGLWLALTTFCMGATAHLWPSVGASVFLAAAIAALAVGLFVDLREV